MRLSRVLARSQRCIAPRVAVRQALALTPPIPRRAPASISSTASWAPSTSRAARSSPSSTSTTAAATSPFSGSEEVIGAGALSLDEILARARTSLGHDDESDDDESKEQQRLVLLSGDGRHLGSDVSWTLLFDLNDDSRRRRRRRRHFAFREDIAGENLSFCWGFDGGRGQGSERREGETSPSCSSCSWEVDERGVAKRLELDDHEALILAAAVRTGWWAREGAGALIERTLVSSPSSQLLAPPLLRLRLLDGGIGDGERDGGGRVEATLELADAESCLPRVLSTPLCGGRERWRFEGWQRWPSAGGLFPARTTHESPSGGTNEFVVRCAREVDEEEAERAFSSPSPPPSSPSAFAGGAGGSRQAVIAAVAAEAEASTSSYSPFSCPVEDSLRPGGASYARDPAPFPFDVPAWWSASGHLLVRPHIDGRPAPGLFLVDSGASGFVIEEGAADELGLEAFGEVYVAGVAGSVRSKFRRSRSLSLGPLRLSSPLFMEMPVAGVVTGGPPGGKSMRAVGILGHDLFRSAVLTLPKRPSTAALTKQKKNSSHVSFPTTATPTRLRLDDPLTYRPPPSSKGRWCDLRFVSNLPHIQATMPLVRRRKKRGKGEEEEEDEVDSATKKRKQRGGEEKEETVVEERSILLMVDSGAGGTDVMFHSRAAEELGLLEQGEEKQSARVVRGVGTGATSSSSSTPNSSSSSSHLVITAVPGSLPWLTLGPIATFAKVRSLNFQSGGLDLSCYSSGIACADLLSRAQVVIDYPRRRLALIPPPGAAAAASGAGAARDARAPRRGIPRGKKA